MLARETYLTRGPQPGTWLYRSGGAAFLVTVAAVASNMAALVVKET